MHDMSLLGLWIELNSGQAVVCVTVREGPDCGRCRCGLVMSAGALLMLTKQSQTTSHTAARGVNDERQSLCRSKLGV